jgi:hypothetical protein
LRRRPEQDPLPAEAVTAVAEMLASTIGRG